MSATSPSKIAPQGAIDLKAPPVLSSKEKVAAFVEGKVMSSVTAILTVYALFGDDIRLAGFSKDADPVFYGISVMALLAFLLEFCLNMYCKPGYLCGFYFALDFVSTISIIPDIGWIWEPLTGAGDDESGSATLKAGRASRAGTKAGRIVRIVRLVRMVRIVRLYKMKNEQEEKEEVEISEPSKVGKILTELTTRRLIILVLVMIIALPIIDGNLDDDYNEFQTYGLQSLHHYTQDYNNSGDITTDDLKDVVLHYARNAGPLLALQVSGISPVITNQWLTDMRFQPLDEDGNVIETAEYSLTENPETLWHASMLTPDAKTTLRSSEYTAVDSAGCYNDAGQCEDCIGDAESPCVSYAYFDTIATSQFSAGINILKTIFIMVILTVGAVMFTRDAQILVIGPIERMMALVNKLAENPLGSTKTKKAAYEEEDEVKGDYETVMLEETLSKIGGLLQVGFGVAGTEIISKNMGGAGELNVMIPGKKITSVFGFGIIEGFTVMCTALEETIIMYINTIADIVHSDAHTYHGAANKNIGNAFLLAWKICDGPLPGLKDPRDSSGATMDDETKKAQREGISVQSSGDGTVSRDITPTELVDSALTAIIQMRIDVYNANRNPLFRQFCDDSRVKTAFETNHYEVHMGFGMHIGWAIEGAIGSKYKIDASYLSPNVNLAARLEAATGQFGVPMLLSEWFVNELSPAARGFCRKIDRVTVKGSEIPMEMWTFDIVQYPSESLVPLMDESGCQLPVDYVSDKRFKTMQEGIDPEFFTLFKQAVDDYIGGNWQDSREALENCLKLRDGDDGPSKKLLGILAETDYIAPATWKGFRALTSK